MPVFLYSAPGRILGVPEFVEQEGALLSTDERRLVAAHLSGLTGGPEIPPGPLVRNRYRSDGRAEYVAEAAGGRSARLAGLDVKIKGCRPADGTFPSWSLGPGFELHRETIPFGTLGAEGVLREVLGACFLAEHGLPRAARPFAVYAYEGPEEPRFALVSHCRGDERVEARFDCGGLTLHQLIRLKRSCDHDGLIGQEVCLRGIDRDRYTARKAELLAAMHFGGGFRGLLNSNVGNDVVAGDELRTLCDFDTFEVRVVPVADDGAGVREFVARAILELLKSSLPFVDIVDGVDADAGTSRDRLAAHYRDASSVYRRYRAQLDARSAALGWPTDGVEQAVNDAFSLDIAGVLLEELIPNSATPTSFSLQTPYVPH